ncbi:MAG: DNA glycosylase [Anaerovoracaceae bacterium]|jgi:N-glycosylase/DNA lyase|nr:DNA glycosylase [Anaerovoracaceae bacterium]
MIEIPLLGDFQPRDTFECGQCFRWESDDEGRYLGVAGGRLGRIEVVENKDERVLLIEDWGLEGNGDRKNGHEDFWHHYLDLGTDYGAIKRALINEDPKMEEIISRGPGIHLLNQDPWETLISFIISQNNHIPRIKKCVESLSTLFGEPLGQHFGKDRYTFPSPYKLASLTEEDLAPVKLGYRTPYLLKAAKMVVRDGEARLSSCNLKSQEEGLKYLLEFPGVGAKVANCMMLYGLGQRDSFPLDIWMKRMMNQLYGFALDDTKAMEAFAREKFGAYGGIAQQYLFNYAIKMSNAK